MNLIRKSAAVVALFLVLAAGAVGCKKGADLVIPPTVSSTAQ